MNLQLLISNSAVLLSGSGLAQGATMLSLLLTARQLGVSGYGQYAACFSLSGFLSLLFSFGLDNWLLGEGRRSSTSLGQFVGSFFFTKIMGGLLWAGGILTVYTFWDSQIFPRNLLLISSLSMLMESLISTLLISLKVSLLFPKAAWLEASADLCWLGGTVGLMALGYDRVEFYMGIRAAVFGLFLLLFLILIWKLYPLRISTSVIGKTFRPALPFAYSDLLSWASLRADVLIVSFFLTQNDVGHYATAVGVLNALFFVPASLFSVTLPWLGQLTKENRTKALIFAKKYIFLSGLLGIVTAGLVWLVSPLLTIVLGENFATSAALFRYLGIILVFKSLSFAFVAILIANGLQARRLLVQFMVVTLNIVLNLLVVRQFGVWGIGSIYIFTEILLAFGYGWISIRKMFPPRASRLSCQP